MAKVLSTLQRFLITLRYFCEKCNRETVWRLVDEDATHEFYKCDDCGAKKGWAVR